MSDDYDTLDVINPDSSLRKFYHGLTDVIEANNPHSQCENYLKEKISKLKGILTAFAERKTQVKTYLARIELRASKLERLMNL